SRRPSGSGPRSMASTCARTSVPLAIGPGWCCAKRATTRSRKSGSVRSERPLTLGIRFDYHRTMAAQVIRISSPHLAPRPDFRLSEAAESLQGLYIAGAQTVRYKEYEIGQEWFDRVRTAMTPELMEVLTPFSSLPRSYSVWCLLITLVAEAPVDMHGFLGYLEAMPAEEVWLQLRSEERRVGKESR